MTALPPVADMVAALEAGVTFLPPRPDNTSAALIERYPELEPVTVEELAIHGPHGPVPARLYRPPAPAGPALLWLHGGAFIAGDLDMPEANWVGLFLASRGVMVVSADYRKALNGVCYPVPADDVLAAWRWTSAARLPGTTTLHLGGASAGAALAAGVTKRLRDGAGPLPGSLILVYPLVHPRLPPPSEALRRRLDSMPEGGLVFSDEAIAELSLHFVGGSPAALEDPYAFAGKGELSGQPPVLIINADYDRLRASGEAYAAALRDSGVEVVEITEPGAVHGHLNEPRLAQAARTLERMATWMVARS
ncbi:MAG TPA: alpha/beta hydrolase fold domain-containing protein [Acidimicrobiales bacterium]|nr:alpha/beta hydrolase fold domain-containing protein [Acidimicrobiales bacterium]